MDRFDFSIGHIFIKSGSWTVFMNGSGNCGRSKSRESAMKDILLHWKFSDKIKSEISKIFDDRKNLTVIGSGEQLELF